MILSSFAWCFISRSRPSISFAKYYIIPILQMGGGEYRESEFSSLWITQQIRAKDRNKTDLPELLACALSRRRSVCIKLVISCYSGPQ